MSPANTQRLYDAFPRLYRGRSYSLQISQMSWGFTCGDGWFELLWTLSEDIEEMARSEGRDPASDHWPEVTQVKEKLGSLRVHLNRTTSSPHMMELVARARDASEQICEACGNPGAPVHHHGIKTRCAEHAQV